MRNPEIKAAVDASGGDYKKAFYTLARQKGVNPDDVLNLLK